MDAVQEQNLLNHFQHNNSKSINVILPVQSTLANLWGFWLYCFLKVDVFLLSFYDNFQSWKIPQQFY